MVSFSFFHSRVSVFWSFSSKFCKSLDLSRAKSLYLSWKHIARACRTTSDGTSCSTFDSPGSCRSVVSWSKCVTCTPRVAFFSVDFKGDSGVVDVRFRGLEFLSVAAFVSVGFRVAEFSFSFAVFSVGFSVALLLVIILYKSKRYLPLLNNLFFVNH